MSWTYIVVRTFPFWAIPVGIGLLISGFMGKKRPLHIISGVIFISMSIAFLFFQGHFRAVPIVHEILN